MTFCCPRVLLNLMFFSYYLNLIIMQTYILKKTLFSFTQSKPVLYIFAGQGTQQKGMLNDLLKIHQAKQQILKYSKILNIDFLEINDTDKQKLISKTKVTQPLLVLSQTLRFKYLQNVELKVHDFMLGHSVGQYSALCIAKSIGLEDCLKLVQKRGQLMEKYTKQASGMLIVRFNDEKREEVERTISESGLQIACFNTPNNVNVAGSLQKLEIARNRFKQAKITCLFLPVSAAFHCNILADMIKPFTQYISGLNFEKPAAKILRNLDTKIYQQDKDIKEGLIQHLTHPVQFQQSVKAINSSIECIQIGHNQVVKKFVEETRKKMKAP